MSGSSTPITSHGTGTRSYNARFDCRVVQGDATCLRFFWKVTEVPRHNHRRLEVGYGRRVDYKRHSADLSLYLPPLSVPDIVSTTSLTPDGIIWRCTTG
jgi:hypothetical protein